MKRAGQDEIKYNNNNTQREREREREVVEVK
jgi:hypothetical protein